MKRREFITTQAAGVLLPGALGSGIGWSQDFRRPAGLSPEEEIVDQRMHPDFKTYVDGMEYFYIGNGEIQGVVQFAPKDSACSFFGFTVTDTEIFGRKWTSFLYHPERGFTNTRAGVTLAERAEGSEGAGMYRGVTGHLLTPETFAGAEWKYPGGVPTVSVRWNAGRCEVEEEFWVPSRGAMLFRTIRVSNGSDRPVDVGVSVSLYANFGLFDRIAVDERTKSAGAKGLAEIRLSCLHGKTSVSGRYDVRADLETIVPGASKEAVYVYSIRGGRRIPGTRTLRVLRQTTESDWSGTTSLTTGNEMLDRMFRASKTGLRSVVSRNGKLDAGQWMYNMEWVSDHSLAIEALLHSGMVEDARRLLERNLRDAIGNDGRTIESSRWFGYDYTELNQNGFLLRAAWVYYCWTGDSEMIRRYWRNIRLCAEFPLQPVFFDEKARMVHNKREFWERSDAYGVEDGFESAYQFWVSHGLARAAELARVVGDRKMAKRWSDVSSRMQEALMRDPVYSMIAEGHWIKRRKRMGEWQRYLIPPDRTKLPAGSPIATEERPVADPDVASTYPIIFGLLDSKGETAAGTLEGMELLWNQRWDFGGYPRYNVTGEDNPPAPWPVASLLVARANFEAGNDARVWRVLHWLDGLNPHKSGSWFERCGQSITPPMPPVGILPWVWYEILAVCVWHLAGIRPETDGCLLKPRLLKGLDRLSTDVKVRGRRITLEVRRDARPSARVNGKTYQIIDGGVRIPHSVKGDLAVEIIVV